MSATSPEPAGAPPAGVPTAGASPAGVPTAGAPPAGVPTAGASPGGAPFPEPSGAPPAAATSSGAPGAAPAATRRAPARGTAGAEDRPLTRGERVFYQFARLVLMGFGKLYWRVRVEGLDRVPKDRPVVISPVHRSNIDTILMAFVSRRHMRYMAKDSLFRRRWSALLISALGGFPVHRDGADRDALRTCEAALRRGESVVVFPEGTRKRGPVVTNLYEGAAFVALRCGVPIVPVGIGGSEGAMPRGAKFLRPVKIHIIVGEPIEPPPRSGVGSRGSRRQVHELTTQLQTELQRLYDEASARASGS